MTESDTAAPQDPSRRDFLQSGAMAAFGGTLAASMSNAQTPSNSSKRPNMIFFFGEGQRADALSLAGNKILQTPNHDRIGREGVYFRNAFVMNALCAPARGHAHGHVLPLHRRPRQ
jgi:hypothetical protein